MREGYLIVIFTTLTVYYFMGYGVWARFWPKEHCYATGFYGP